MINTEVSFPLLDKNLVLEISTKKTDKEGLFKHLGLGDKDLVKMNQVHGTKIAWVGKKDLGKEVSQTDGLIAAEKGVFLQARVADCLPVCYFDPETKVVGIAHCGWRGLLAGLAGKMIEELKCEGIDPARVKVWIGPGARKCCYEVSEDLAASFKEKFGPSVVEEREEKTYLNLSLSVKTALQASGVEEERIADSQICTIHNSETYHSFRADKKTSQVNLAFIGYKS